jgi:hypothetical protein
MFVLCSLALPWRFIEPQGGAARRDEGSSPVGARDIPHFEFW